MIHLFSSADCIDSHIVRALLDHSQLEYQEIEVRDSTQLDFTCYGSTPVLQSNKDAPIEDVRLILRYIDEHFLHQATVRADPSLVNFVFEELEMLRLTVFPSLSSPQLPTDSRVLEKSKQALEGYLNFLSESRTVLQQLSLETDLPRFGYMSLQSERYYQLLEQHSQELFGSVGIPEELRA